ncbi:MAG: hypothetical protein AAFW47_01705 [Pseudomonadota bacterium]
MKIGVVCGFDGEIACFERAIAQTGLDPSAFSIMASGASAERARACAEYLVELGAKKLISFGICGGLDPHLQIGDVVFSAHVITTLDESYGARQAPRKQALRLATGSQLMSATVCGVDDIVFHPNAKSALFGSTGAGVADMESHAVARTAHAHSIPFYVLRSISDAARDELPTYLSSGVSESGKPRLTSILAGLARRPSTLSLLLRLQKNTKTALKSLEQATVKLMPALART